MLITPDSRLFLHMLRENIQNKLLHHLTRDEGEANGPVISWVHLLALFEHK